jgi:hypothetical protein
MQVVHGDAQDAYHVCAIPHQVKIYTYSNPWLKIVYNIFTRITGLLFVMQPKLARIGLLGLAKE